MVTRCIWRINRIFSNLVILDQLAITAVIIYIAFIAYFVFDYVQANSVYLLCITISIILFIVQVSFLHLLFFNMNNNKPKPISIALANDNHDPYSIQSQLQSETKNNPPIKDKIRNDLYFTHFANKTMLNHVSSTKPKSSESKYDLNSSPNNIKSVNPKEIITQKNLNNCLSQHQQQKPQIINKYDRAQLSHTSNSNLYSNVNTSVIHNEFESATTPLNNTYNNDDEKQEEKSECINTNTMASTMQIQRPQQDQMIYALPDYFATDCYSNPDTVIKEMIRFSQNFLCVSASSLKRTNCFGKKMVDSMSNVIYQWTFEISFLGKGARVWFGVDGWCQNELSGRTINCKKAFDAFKIGYGYEINSRRCGLSGDIITMRLDLNNKCLSFKHNFKDVKNATINNIMVKNKFMYRMAVIFRHQSNKSSVKLIHASSVDTNEPKISQIAENDHSQHKYENNREEYDRNVKVHTDMIKMQNINKCLEMENVKLRASINASLSECSKQKAIINGLQEKLQEESQQHKSEIQKLSKQYSNEKDILNQNYYQQIHELKKKLQSQQAETIEIQRKWGTHMSSCTNTQNRIEQYVLCNSILLKDNIKLKNCIDEQKNTINEQNNIKEQLLNRNKECVVCLDEERSYSCIPCGHLCLCAKCKDRINHTCPLCQKKCNDIIKIFR